MKLRKRGLNVERAEFRISIPLSIGVNLAPFGRQIALKFYKYTLLGHLRTMSLLFILTIVFTISLSYQFMKFNVSYPVLSVPNVHEINIKITG